MYPSRRVEPADKKRHEFEEKVNSSNAQANVGNAKSSHYADLSDESKNEIVQGTSNIVKKRIEQFTNLKRKEESCEDALIDLKPGTVKLICSKLEYTYAKELSVNTSSEPKKISTNPNNVCDKNKPNFILHTSHNNCEFKTISKRAGNGSKEDETMCVNQYQLDDIEGVTKFINVSSEQNETKNSSPAPLPFLLELKKKLAARNSRMLNTDIEDASESLCVNTAHNKTKFSWSTQKRLPSPPLQEKIKTDIEDATTSNSIRNSDNETENNSINSKIPPLPPSPPSPPICTSSSNCQTKSSTSTQNKLPSSFLLELQNKIAIRKSGMPNTNIEAVTKATHIKFCNNETEGSNLTQRKLPPSLLQELKEKVALRNSRKPNTDISIENKSDCILSSDYKPNDSNSTI